MDRVSRGNSSRRSLPILLEDGSSHVGRTRSSESLLDDSGGFPAQRDTTIDSAASTKTSLMSPERLNEITAQITANVLEQLKQLPPTNLSDRASSDPNKDPRFVHAYRSPPLLPVQYSAPPSPSSVSDRGINSANISRPRSRHDSSEKILLEPLDPERGTSEFEYWGSMIDYNGNATPRLDRLLRGAAQHIIDNYEQQHSIAISPEKMQEFYRRTKIKNEMFPWDFVFDDRTSSISRLMRELGVSHILSQERVSERPDIPGLTPAGFATWMTFMIRAYPDSEFERLSNFILHVPITDPDNRDHQFPKAITRQSFPEHSDYNIVKKLQKSILDHCGVKPREESTAPGQIGRGTTSISADHVQSAPSERERKPYVAKLGLGRNYREWLDRTSIERRTNRPLSSGYLHDPSAIVVQADSYPSTSDRDIPAYTIRKYDNKYQEMTPPESARESFSTGSRYRSTSSKALPELSTIARPPVETLPESSASSDTKSETAADQDLSSEVRPQPVVKVEADEAEIETNQVDALSDSVTAIESPINPSGCQRITWNCSCGMQLFDYYTELVPGSLKLLQAQLNECNSGQAQASIAGVLERAQSIWSRAVGQVAQDPSTTQSDVASKTTQEDTPAPQKPATTQEVQSSTDIPFPAINVAGIMPTISTSATVSYLLLCIPEGLSGLKLQHLQIIRQTSTNPTFALANRITNDKDLFQLLRGKYRSERQISVSKFWPRTVIRVSMAYFLVDLSEYIELKHFGCLGARPDECRCIPPKDLLQPSPNAQYSCTPIEPPYRPPIGTNYLTHYFQSPSCIKSDQAAFVLNQLPKRVGQCIVTSGIDRVEAWGLEFEEGWDQGRLRNVLFLVTLFGSLVFAFLWAVLKKDAQTAFTVSAFFVGLVTVVGGYTASAEPRVIHK